MSASWMQGKTWEEWDAIWRLQFQREDEMLAYRDAFVGHISNKALAEKFNLKPTRVASLVRRHVAERERARMANEIEQLKADTFTLKAERLWMDLGWLAMELEKRRGLV